MNKSMYLLNFQSDIFYPFQAFCAHALFDPEGIFSGSEGDCFLIYGKLYGSDGTARAEPASVRFCYFNINGVPEYFAGAVAYREKTPEVCHFIVNGMPQAQVDFVRCRPCDSDVKGDVVVQAPLFIFQSLVFFKHSGFLASSEGNDQKYEYLFFHWCEIWSNINGREACI